MSQPDSSQALETVLRNPAIWRADQTHARYPGISTTFPALDQALPDAGWPAGVLTELLVRENGIGELSLLLPALRAICAEARGIALLAPPWLPQARAWEAAGIPLERLLVVDSSGVDLLWATEQILRSSECGAVLAWGQAAGRALNHRALQRLHLAAGAGNALCFLYRSTGAADAPSPAPLRIRLAAHAGALQLHLVKCRGVMRTKPLRIEVFPAHWQRSPAQVLPAASPAAIASAADTAEVQTAFTPTLVTALPHEKANVKASSETAPASIEARELETGAMALQASRISAATCLHSTDVQTSSASLFAATSDLCAATPDLLASSITSAPECVPVPAATSRNTSDAPVFPDPVFAADASQRNTGGAAITPDALQFSDTALFPAVHSRISVA